MESPSRKIFNLFAFSLLAFAIYLNFIHNDEAENVNIKKSAANVRVPNRAEQALVIDDAKSSILKNN